MPFEDTIAAAQRALIRETAGAVLRAKQDRAANLVRIGEFLTVRAESLLPIDREDFIQAGSEDNVEPAVIHTVAQVESSQGGFENGRLVICAEPHVFSKLTMRAFDAKYPHLSYPEWKPYRKNEAPPAGFPQHPYTYDQDNRWYLVAMWGELAGPDAAIGAMSAGRFQQVIGSPRADMGWKLLRMASAEALFRKLAKSERDQLEVFRLYFRAHGAIGALREKNWRVIARVYNGPGQVDRYAGLLEQTYRKTARLYS